MNVMNCKDHYTCLIWASLFPDTENIYGTCQNCLLTELRIRHDSLAANIVGFASFPNLIESGLKLSKVGNGRLNLMR
jgi:hypothetical protein